MEAYWGKAGEVDIYFELSQPFGFYFGDLVQDENDENKQGW